MVHKHDFNYNCPDDWEWYVQVYRGKSIVKLSKKVNTLFNNPVYVLNGFFVKEKTWQLTIPIWHSEA